MVYLSLIINYLELNLKIKNSIWWNINIFDKFRIQFINLKELNFRDNIYSKFLIVY